MDAWMTDVRYALRGLVRRPGMVTVAVLTLALGVGANAALFTVVNGVLLRPFDLPEAERVMVLLDRSSEGGAPYRTTGGAWSDWRRDNRTFDDMALLGGWTFNLTEPELEPERILAMQVSASYFDVLGVAPALGRAFRPEENQGQHRVVILSDALWRGRYGGDPDMVGQTVMVNQDESWQVVGVMPPAALPMVSGPLAMTPTDREPVAWVPADMTQEWLTGYRSHVFVALGRLQRDVTIDEARDDLARIGVDITGRQPDLYAGIVPDVRSLRDTVLGDVRRDLFVLLGGVGLLLLVACANLTNLLLARAMDRRRELAVRAAVGASGGRLVRLGLLEALFLGIAGGAVGLLAAVGALDALLALLPDDLPRATDIAVDGTVLAFTLGLSVAAGLLTGLVPALRGDRPRLPAALKAGGRGSVGTGGTRAARTLVAAQLALACVLLVGAGLLVRSVQALHTVDLGARTDRTLAVEFLLAQQGGREEVVAFMRDLEERVAALPGVEGAALAYNTPLDADWTETFSVLDRPPPGPGERPGADFRTVSPGYFELMDIAPVAGRTLEGADGPDGAPVVVVNETFARQHFDGEEVLGRRIGMGTARAMWGDEAPAEWEIVGVVPGVRMRGLRRPAPAAMYFSQRQMPTTIFRLLVRTRGEPLSLLPEVRAVVAELDPRLPLSSITTLDELRAQATAQDRFNALFLGAFALVALLVAAAGIYGVLAYAVARRTTEMGVRMALGARPAGVFRLLVREGMGMAAIGIVVGLAGALAGARLLDALLFGVTTSDPAVLVLATGVLAAVVLVAGVVPARRAARTDPAVALRGE